MHLVVNVQKCIKIAYEVLRVEDAPIEHDPV
jgi:hypothetical protein